MTYTQIKKKGFENIRDKQFSDLRESFIRINFSVNK